MKARILYLISGILFLIVSLMGGAWWELFVGEASKPLLYAGISPFQVEVKLLDSESLELSPFLKALLLSERALAMFWSITMIIGAFTYKKTWSRKLVNTHPFTTTLGFVLLLVIGVTALPFFMPQVAQIVPNLGEVLIPYSSHYLTVNIYQITRMEGTVGLSVLSGFTLQFWIALASGIACLAGAVVRRREWRLGKSVYDQGIFGGSP
jgi:hypothetical protein